jgi:nucleotide-binding universal stress UspA family protein
MTGITEEIIAGYDGSADSVVAGIDGSPASLAALEFAREEAALRGLPLLAVCALADAPASWAAHARWKKSPAGC